MRRPGTQSAGSAPTQTRTGRDERIRPATLIVLGALAAFGPLSMDLYLPGLPGLADGLRTSPAGAQLTLTACLLGLAIGQLVSGPWSDAVGRRRPLIIGVTAYVATSLLCAVAPSITLLVALRFAQGFAGAAGIVISRAVVRDVRSGEAAARLFAALLLVNGLAPIVSPIIGGQLLHVTDWRGIFVVLSAVGAAILAGVAAFVPESLTPDRRRVGGLADTREVLRGLLGERAVVGCTLAIGLAAAAMFAYIGGSPFVLQGIYDLSPSQFSVVFAANGVGLVLAVQLSSSLMARRAPSGVLALGLAVGVLGASILLLATLAGVGLVGVLPALFLVVASLGLLVPSATAIALQDHPDEAGSASALLGVAQFAFGALVAPLVGIAGESTALPMAVVIVICSTAAMAAYIALIARPTRRPRAVTARPARPLPRG